MHVRRTTKKGADHSTEKSSPDGVEKRDERRRTDTRTRDGVPNGKGPLLVATRLWEVLTLEQKEKPAPKLHFTSSWLETGAVKVVGRCRPSPLPQRLLDESRRGIWNRFQILLRHSPRRSVLVQMDESVRPLSAANQRSNCFKVHRGVCFFVSVSLTGGG
ncbi:unnamed protein product [Ectocarpus sp. 4 AP-2014]